MAGWYQVGGLNNTKLPHVQVRQYAERAHDTDSFGLIIPIQFEIYEYSILNFTNKFNFYDVKLPASQLMANNMFPGIAKMTLQSAEVVLHGFIPRKDWEEEPIKIIWKEYFDPFLVIKVQPDMSFYLALC